MEKTQTLKKYASTRTLKDIENELKKGSNSYLYEAFSDTFNRVDNITYEPLKIALLGEFSAGKSSFINKLTGKDILPVDYTPTTAVVTTLKHSKDERIEVVYRFKKNDELSSVVYAGADRYEKLRSIQEQEKDEKDENDILSLEEIRVYIDNSILKSFHILDTPGFNDTNNMSQATEAIFDKVNYVIWLFNAQQAAKLTENVMLENFRQKSQYKNNVYAVLNWGDAISEEDDKDYAETLKKLNESLEKFQEYFSNKKIYLVSSKAKMTDFWNKKFRVLERDLNKKIIEVDQDISERQIEEEIEQLEVRIENAINQLENTKGSLEKAFDTFVNQHNQNNIDEKKIFKETVLNIIKSGVKKTEQTVKDSEFYKKEYTPSLLKFTAFYSTAEKLKSMKMSIEDEYKSYIVNFADKFNKFKDDLQKIQVGNVNLRDTEFRSDINKKLDELSSNLEVLKNSKQILIVGYLIGLLSDDYIYNIIKREKESVNISEDPIMHLLEMDLNLGYFLTQIKDLRTEISKKFVGEIDILERSMLMIEKYKIEPKEEEKRK